MEIKEKGGSSINPIPVSTHQKFPALILLYNYFKTFFLFKTIKYFEKELSDLPMSIIKRNNFISTFDERSFSE